MVNFVFAEAIGLRRYSSHRTSAQMVTPARNVGLMTQFESVSGPICVKSRDQTFSGTVFVSQKTCLTTVDYEAVCGSTVVLHIFSVFVIPFHYA